MSWPLTPSEYWPYVPIFWLLIAAVTKPGGVGVQPGHVKKFAVTSFPNSCQTLTAKNGW